MSEQVAARTAEEPPTRPVMRALRIEPPAPTPERTTRGTRLDGLDMLRAIASCLVFYTHVATWYRYKNQPLGLTEVLDDDVIGPLHLNKDLSFFGVSLFFLISGFVMAHVATKERAGE